MRLHTDFHDYYDTAVGFGIDENVHYNRFTKIVEKKLKLEIDLPTHNHGRSCLLGFCGEIYPLIQIIERDENHKPKFTYYTYSYEEYFDRLMKTESVIERIKSELWWQSCKENDKEIHKTLTKWLRKERIKTFFSDWRKSDDRLFLEHKVPIWLLNLDSFDRKITLNPKLAELDFERLKDANTTFQEISMYLSNILVEQKETVAIEDKYRIEQHGFDLKSSFRKEKQK
jgi:hypothetical protein